jgi:hypothetical protein
MKKKILLSFLVIVVLAICTLIGLPFLFKDKIASVFKQELNKQVNAKIDYSDFDLSLIRSFPNFRFSVDDFTVVGINEFKNDTLASVKNYNFTVDLMSVINGGPYKLISLNVNQPVVHARVNYLGKANWDIVKESKGETTSTSNSKFSLEIKKFSIADADITYDDKKSSAYASLKDFDFEASGDVTESIYDLVIKSAIASLTYKSGAVAYLSDAKLLADVALKVDNMNSKYTFGDNSISINDLALNFEGWVQNNSDELNLDCKFKTRQTDFKNILSLIPAIYKKDFDKIKTSGSLALDGVVKGKLKDENYPSLNLNLKVNNGMFKYPDLPVAVKNIYIATTIAKPQGKLDATVVDISKLHLEAGSDPVDGKILIKTPVSDPDVDARLTGRMDLANVPKFYPIDGLKKMTGLLSLNLNFKGKQSDFESKNYQAVSASGNARVSNLVYESMETPMPVKVMAMDMDFSPQQVDLKSISSIIGKSDFNATGKLGNFMAYLFGKGSLDGYLSLRSAKFDANEWLSKETKASATTANTSSDPNDYFKVPKLINFTAQSTFGKILYEQLVLENVKGEVKVKDEVIYLNDLFANLLGGNALISAIYDTKDRDYPEVSFTYDINNFDFQETYKYVGMADKMAPVIKHIQGSFSSDLKGAGKLNKDMSVDYSTLTGDGKVEIPSARIVGMPILQKVGEVSKIPALQNLQLTNAMTVLKFKDGKVNVDPTKLNFGKGYTMDLKGANGFDKTIDYDFQLNVPSKELGAATSLAQGYLSKIPGLGASMPEIVSFVFKATGTADKPKVTLSKVLANGSSAKNVIQSKAEDLKKQAEEETKKQTDALKKQAEDAAAKAKSDAEKRAKEAAEKAKKEAENKLKDIFKFPK